MPRFIRLPKLTFPKVVAAAAILLVASAGAAYADNEWTGANIVDSSLTGADLAPDTITHTDIASNTVRSIEILNGGVKSVDIFDGAVTTDDVADGSLSSTDVLNETLTADDLASNSVGQSEIQTDGVAALEIQDNSIDSGEIVDFSLTNQDIGVLFAQVNADGTLANSSGAGVTSARVGAVGAGTYEVDFARNVTACAFTATVAPAGAGSSLGEVNVADRAANVEAVFVDTNNSSGTAADRPFSLMVVC